MKIQQIIESNLFAWIGLIAGTFVLINQVLAMKGGHELNTKKYIVITIAISCILIFSYQLIINYRKKKKTGQ